jgi:hypothetical protein
MKDLGIGICIIGSIIAILFVPCQFLGISTGWHFIFGGGRLRNEELLIN